MVLDSTGILKGSSSFSGFLRSWKNLKVRPEKSWNLSVVMGSHGKLCSWYKISKAAYIVGKISKIKN